MKFILSSILIICIVCLISAQVVSQQNERNIQYTSRDKKKRIREKSIIRKQQKQIQKFETRKNSFQSYHFELRKGQRQQVFYIDGMTNDEVKGYLKVLWKYRNSYVLPRVLSSQKMTVKVYENEKRIITKGFYTKCDIQIIVKKESVYKLRISHKSKAIVNKLVSFHIEHYFQQFQQTQVNYEDESSSDLQNDRKNNIKADSSIVSRQQKYDESSEQSSSESVNSQMQIQNSKIPRKFTFPQLKQRISLFLNQTKLLINEAQMKHLAEYKTQQIITQSIQIYWHYELVQCCIVVLCVGLEIFLVQKLFQQSKILI